MLALIVAVWATVDAARVRDWQDELFLWASALQHTPTDARALVNFAGQLELHGYHALARTQYLALAGRVDDITPARGLAQQDIQRLRVREEDLQAWFQDKPVLIALPPPRY